jgi:hypothetical protein
MPQYQIGEESVIFLSAESRLGFTSPVGLQQGQFRVETDASEKKQVINGMGNHGLFIGWKQSPKFKSMTMTSTEKGLLKTNGGQLPYPEFLSLIKKLVSP